MKAARKNIRTLHIASSNLNMKDMSRVTHGCNPGMAEDRRTRGVQGYTS